MSDRAPHCALNGTKQSRFSCKLQLTTASSKQVWRAKTRGVEQTTHRTFARMHAQLRSAHWQARIKNRRRRRRWCAAGGGRLAHSVHHPKIDSCAQQLGQLLTMQDSSRPPICCSPRSKDAMHRGWHTHVGARTGGLGQPPWMVPWCRCVSHADKWVKTHAGRGAPGQTPSASSAKWHLRLYQHSPRGLPSPAQLNFPVQKDARNAALPPAIAPP